MFIGRSVVAVTVCLIAGCTGAGDGAPGLSNGPDAAVPPARASAVRLPALDHAARVEILSLDPFDELQASEGAFYEWGVLGRAAVNDPATRARLIAVLRESVWKPGVESAFCFHPRHGLHAEGEDGTTTDMVICFECSSYESFENGEQTAGGPIANAPEALFNDVLRKAGVPMTKSFR